MTAPRDLHETTLSGLRVISGEPHQQRGIINQHPGTLTGLARKRVSNRRVLVTAAHVMAARGGWQDPTSNRKLFGGRVIKGGEIGDGGIEYISVSDPTIDLDVAIINLVPGARAEFKLHSFPTHSERFVISGVREPSPALGRLSVVGQQVVETTAQVVATDLITYVDGRKFKNVVELRTAKAIRRGDSGSGVFARVGENRFRLVCIIFGGNLDTITDSSTTAYAVPASMAEKALGFTFGRGPIAIAGDDSTVDGGEVVKLKGLGFGPDRDPLSFHWTAPPGIGLSDGSLPQPTFTAPRLAEETPLIFKLRVTDSFAGWQEDTVTHTVRASEIWGEWMDTGKTADLGATKEQKRTSNLGNVEYRWVAVPIEWGPWYKVPVFEGCGPDRLQRERRDSTNTQASQARMVPAPEEYIWGEWENTGRLSDDGATFEQKRTSHCDTVHTQWLIVEWGEWKDTGVTNGCGSDKTKQQKRTSNADTVEFQFVADPEEYIWGEWENTGRLSDDGATFEQKRTSHCDTVDTQWLVVEWGEWEDTGVTNGCGPDKTKQQKRTSNADTVEFQFVADPEEYIWGEWEDTGKTGDMGATKEQKRTSHCNTVEYQWVANPEVWGEWADTGTTDGCGPTKRKQQKRTSNHGNVEYQWVNTPEAEEWGEWADTGRTGDNGATKEQKRTSNCGNTQTRWVAVPIETWGEWADTGTTDGCGPTKRKQQQRTSSFGNTQTRWVATPEAEQWGEWVDTGRTGDLGSTKEQKRTSNCGNVETRWVVVS